mgnify:FL=1
MEAEDNSDLVEKVKEWVLDDPDPETANQLRILLAAGGWAELQKYFSGFLQFGTAGLRGPIGPGPSGMNRAVVGRTASGLARFMKARGLSSIVIGRDA